MSEILFNPDNGALISDVTFDGVRYFAEKSFDPGSLFKFEDEKTAGFFLDTFQFLETVTIDKAKELMNKPMQQCDQCEFKTRAKSTLTIHVKKHVAEAELDELGIPVVRQTNQQKVSDSKVVNNIQKQIDGEGQTFGDGYPGLTEGEGLVDEKVSRGAVMS